MTPVTDGSDAYTQSMLDWPERVEASFIRSELNIASF